MENTKKNQHYRPCPNCLGNLLQKKSKSKPFLHLGIIEFSVEACTDCLTDPGKMDQERIKENLIRFSDWHPAAAEQAAKTLITGEAPAPAEVVDGVIVPVREVTEPVIFIEEAVITREAAMAG